MRLAVLFVAATMLGTAAHAACPPPPAAVVDIDANSYYTDAHHSVVDPERRARNIAATKPIEDYLAAVADRASAFQRSGDAADAGCALRWLRAWADGGAMLGRMTSNQSYYQRKWTLAGLALAYARVRSEAAPAQRAAIDAWLGALAEATLAHADAGKGARNNHYYWEGLAVAAAGAVIGEPRYVAWARNVFDTAMAQVRPDGTLPLELDRAGKALHYHAFAATPLVMLASILDVHAEALDRLVRVTIAGAADPREFERRTGFTQEPLALARQSWLAVHARHEGGQEWRVAPAGRYPRLGGDLALPNPLEHVQRMK